MFFMSAIIHFNASLCSLKIPNNLVCYLLSREDEMFSSKVFSFTKNAYSKVSSNKLSSSFSGDSDDRLGFLPVGASCSILDFHLLLSMDGDEWSKALTSSTDLLTLKSKQKWVKHICKWSSLIVEGKVWSSNFSIKSISNLSLSRGSSAMLKIFNSIVNLPKDNYIFLVLHWMCTSIVAKKRWPRIIRMCFFESCTS